MGRISIEAEERGPELVLSLPTLREIVGRYSLLTPGEERTLLQKAKAGDSGAIHSLVLANLRFVLQQSWKKCLQVNRPDLLESFFQEGAIALQMAIRSFDLEQRDKDGQPLRFLTYASYLLRREIDHCYLREKGDIGEPSHFGTYRKLVWGVIESLKKSGQPVTVQRIIDCFYQWEGDSTHHGSTRQKELTVKSVLQEPFKTASLNAKVGLDEERELYEIIPDILATPFDEDQFFAEEDIRQALVQMATERPDLAEVIRLKFGLNGEALSLREIAGVLGITYQGVAYRLRTAINYLRRSIPK